MWKIHLHIIYIYSSYLLIYCGPGLIFNMLCIFNQIIFCYISFIYPKFVIVFGCKNCIYLSLFSPATETIRDANHMIVWALWWTTEKCQNKKNCCQSEDVSKVGSPIPKHFVHTSKRMTPHVFRITDMVWMISSKMCHAALVCPSLDLEFTKTRWHKNHSVWKIPPPNSEVLLRIRCLILFQGLSTCLCQQLIVTLSGEVSVLWFFQKPNWSSLRIEAAWCRASTYCYLSHVTHRLHL